LSFWAQVEVEDLSSTSVSAWRHETDKINPLLTNIKHQNKQTKDLCHNR